MLEQTLASEKYVNIAIKNNVFLSCKKVYGYKGLACTIDMKSTLIQI